MYNKAWYEAHRDKINEKRRMRHAEDSDEVNEKRRQDYARRRNEILRKQREDRQECPLCRLTFRRRSTLPPGMHVRDFTAVSFFVLKK